MNAIAPPAVTVLSIVKLKRLGDDVVVPLYSEELVLQSRRDGLLRWALRYVFYRRWRIWYRAQALAAAGVGAAESSRILARETGWPYEHVSGLVCAARTSRETGR